MTIPAEEFVLAPASVTDSAYRRVVSRGVGLANNRLIPCVTARDERSKDITPCSRPTWWRKKAHCRGM